MKIVNWLENSLIAIVVLIVGLFAFNQLKFKPMQKQFEKQIKEQNMLIDKLSTKETYKIENTFDKLKAKDGSIDINLNSKIAAGDTVNNQPKEEKKKGLFNWFKN